MGDGGWGMGDGDGGCKEASQCDHDIPSHPEQHCSELLKELNSVIKQYLVYKSL